MAKSSAAAARDKARKAMLELQKQRAERDARVQVQVEQFYVAAEGVDAAAEKLAAAQAAHKQAELDAHDVHVQVVQTLATDEKLREAEIASLCGITLQQVRSLRRTTPAAATTNTSRTPASDTGQGTDAEPAADTPAASASAA